MMRPRSILALAAVTALPAACLDSSITGTRPISIVLEATPANVSVSEVVTFSFVASGTDIGAVIVDFGDDSADTLTYPNPVEVADQLTHAYDSAGGFTAVATVITPGGRDDDEVAVTVNQAR